MLKFFGTCGLRIQVLRHLQGKAKSNQINKPCRESSESCFIHQILRGLHAAQIRFSHILIT